MFLWRFLLCVVLLPLVCMLQGCGVNLDAKHTAGYAVVVFMDTDNSVEWQAHDFAFEDAPASVNVGGAYRAAALLPGVYSVKSVYNSSPISRYGRGSKDLDYGPRLAQRAGLQPDDSEPALGRVLVKRMPIKEEQNLTPSWDTVVREVSSQYKMRFSLDKLAGGDYKNLLYFEVQAGDVVLLPSLSATIEIDEQACVRWGRSQSQYAEYENPYLRYPLSHNPEDFWILEWACPLNKLSFVQVMPSVEDARAQIDSDKFSPALLEQLSPRDFTLGRNFAQAKKVSQKKAPSANVQYIEYVFSEP